MPLPKVAVLIPTYNRGRLLTENLGYLGQYLKGLVDITLFIGDDSDDDTLAFDCPGIDCKFPLYYERHAERKGLGANLNWLSQKAHEYQLAIALDDDHRLIERLDITPYADKLLADRSAGWIRLMGTGGHKLEARLEGLFWRVSWFSPELYIASFRAHLFKHRQWAEMYGPFPEGLKLGQTEEHFNHQCIDIARGRVNSDAHTLDVLVPLSAPEDSWTETGHSWQLEGL